MAVTGEVTLCAFVDESESRQDLDPGTYILSAALCDAGTVLQLRDRMEAMRPARGGKLHWKSVPAGQKRTTLVKEVAALGVEHLVVIRLGGVEASSERRRRLCLRRLFHELDALGVTNVVAESRGRADDRRDRNLLPSDDDDDDGHADGAGLGHRVDTGIFVGDVGRHSCGHRGERLIGQ